MVIVKAPTKHGLDRKFKSWRRGKSEKSNKRTSLKQQLRGIERLLQKLPEGDKERRDELEKKVQALKQEIGDKQMVIQEKKHAEKAHGQRFLDRQRLTRQEKQSRKQKSTTTMESQLFKIALDQVYVAHHPNDVKYMPLFRKGERVVDNSRQLYRRAVTRRRILKALTKEKRNCTWIAKDQYDRLPSVEWTIQDEERIFGGSVTRQGMKESKKSMQKANHDSRFELAPQHDAVLQVADQVNAELDDDDDDDESESKEENPESEVSENEATKEKGQEKAKDRNEKAKDEAESDDSSDTSSSSEDEETGVADPLRRLKKNIIPVGKKSKQVQTTVGESNSSDSDSSDDSSSDEDDVKKEQGQEQGAEDSSSDDSDSRGDISDEGDAHSVDEPKRKAEAKDMGNADDEIDDFLMDANNEDDVNVFSMTLNRVPALDGRGDKSKGWETQKQRPGQFKKRRTRT